MDITNEIKALCERANNLFYQPRSRVRRVTITPEMIMAVVRKAALSGLGADADHGGSVSASYRHPASTECYAIVAMADGDCLRLAIGVGSMPACAATSAGAMRHALLGGGYGPWWMYMQGRKHKDPLSFSDLRPLLSATWALSAVKAALVAEKLLERPPQNDLTALRGQAEESACSLGHS